MNKIDKISKKSLKIWNKYFYNKKYKKDIEMYEKAIKMYKRALVWYQLRESIYEKIAYSFLYLWDSKSALKYCEEWLKYSSRDYRLLELIVESLNNLWMNEKAKYYIDKLNSIDEWCNNYELDLEKLYNNKNENNL